MSTESKLVYKVAFVLALIIFICCVLPVCAGEGNESIVSATTNETALNNTVMGGPTDTIPLTLPEPIPTNITPEITDGITPNDTVIVIPTHTILVNTTGQTPEKIIPKQITDIANSQLINAESVDNNQNLSDQTGLNFTIKDNTFEFTPEKSKKIELNQVSTAEKSLRIPGGVKKYKLVSFNQPRINTNLRSVSPDLTIKINGVDYLTDLKQVTWDMNDDGIDSYSGTLVGQKDSLVLLTISDNATIGSIQLNNETFFIEPLLSPVQAEITGKPLHVIYSSKDFEGGESQIDKGAIYPKNSEWVTRLNFIADNISPSRTTDSGIRNVQQMDTAASSPILVKVLVATDKKFYDDCNAATIDWRSEAADIFLEVNTQFTRDDIGVIFVPIYDDNAQRRLALSNKPMITSDPLTAFGGTGGNLQDGVYTYSILNGADADVGLYLGGYDADDSTEGNTRGFPEGRFSWVQMVADANDHGLGYNGNDYDRRVVVTHELGHLFFANHEGDDGLYNHPTTFDFGIHRTVMYSTYNPLLNTPQFSSSSAGYHGDGSHDNAQMIRNTKNDVANRKECATTAPPGNSYTISPPQTSINTNVVFTPSAGNNENFWIWNFGDGYGSVEQTPKHQYSTAGTYTVKLITANCHGGSGENDQTITITAPTQSVSPSATPTTTTVGGTVYFTDKSTPPPTSWNWSFGDGATSTLQNPQHTYTEIGSYTINLTVIQDGVSNTTILENYITVVSLTPEASFTANTTLGKPPLAVAFTDLSTKSPTNWSWNFGDGGTSTLQNPVHAYSSEGIYDVSLIASNTYGSSPLKTEIGYITVTNASFVPQNGSSWNLATSNAQWPGKSDFSAMVYNNKMWVMGGLPAKNDVWSSNDGVTWTQETAAAWSDGRNRFSAVTFNNKMWVLGGNKNGPALNDTWYSTTGSSWTRATAAAQWLPRYDQTALVHNNRIWIMGGQDNSADKNDVWSSADGVTWNLATWNAPWTARHGASSVSFNGTIWLFGGEDLAGTKFNDVWYSNEGIFWTRAANAAWSPRYQPQAFVYDNKMWITGGQDNTGTKNDVWYSTNGVTWMQATGNANWPARSSPQALVFSNTMWIMGGGGNNDVWFAGSRTPFANFSANNTYGFAPLTIVFTDTSNNVPTSWLWNFGDNQTSTQKNPIHSYVSPGTYTVSLKAINEAGNNTLVRSNYITVTAVPLPDGSNWTLATSNAAWSGRYEFSTTVYNNKMWVMGGLPAKNDVWSSSDGITWTQATSAALWPGRKLFSAITFNNRMWVLGGNANGPLKNDVWYSTTGSSWTQATAAAAWAARYDQTAVVHNSRIWVLGGRDNSNYKNDVWSSADGISWTAATNNAPWTARSGPSSVSFNGKIWILGGLSGMGSRLNDVWYSADGTTWIQATANAAWSGRYQPQAVVYDGKIWIMGGTDNTGAKNDIWYSTDGVTWMQVTGNANWTARNPQALIFNNTVWIVGGSGYNDVWYASTPTPPDPIPVANFTATPTNGPAPLTVRFNDTSTGSPTSWLWDFGDGTMTNAAEQNPVHTYNSTGSFTVNLTATNADGINTITKPGYIQSDSCIISSPFPVVPVAIIDGNTTSGDVPLTVAFNGSAAGYSAENWLWNFGDGQTSTLQNPVHTYTVRGNYTISLTVNTCAGTASSSLTNWIRAGYYIVTAGESQNNSTITVPKENFIRVKLYQTLSPGYEWEFDVTPGLNIVSTQYIPDPNPYSLDGMGGNHVWDVYTAEPGEQSITAVYCRPWNPYNGNTTFRLNVTVNSQSPVANFTTSVVTGTVPLTIMFNDTSTNSPTSWYWGFGDGYYANGRNTTWLYNIPGNYTINHSATNEWGTGWINRTEYIRALDSFIPPSAPDANFTASPTSGSAPLTVQFIDTSTGDPTSWTWDFGDSSMVNSTQQNPVHSYLSAGTFTVTLNATNSAGNNTTTKLNHITVTPPIIPPIVNFITNVSSGYAPLAVGFTDRSTGKSLNRWNWSFGDGTWFNTTIASQKSPSHRYTTPGIYTASLITCNASGCNTTVPGKIITVNLLTIPVVKFAVNVSSGYAPLAVKFTDQSMGSPTRWNWSFGDGTWFNTTVSSQKSPSYVYATPGNYTSQLTTCNAAGCNTTVPGKAITVNLLTAPVVKFAVNVSSGYAPLAVKFTDQSTSGPARWNWSFGDSTWFNTTVSSQKSPSYVYAIPGNYSVQLTTCNAAGCNTTIPGKIITVTLLTAPVVKFTANKSSGYAPLTIKFTDQSTGSPTRWNWSFGDNSWFNTTTLSEKSPTHVYTGAGTFNATLVACNTAGCNTTAMIKTITVNG